MRIGEVLLRHEMVDVWELAHALKQPAGAAHQRLVSMLIGRALLDPEDGAMALSEQLGYPAALERHLERRDPACEDLLPRELVQRWAVLPLGRSSDGRLVVVARDPTPILIAALEHASHQRITLAVAPGLYLQKLIRSVYGLEIAETARPEDGPSLRDTAPGIEIVASDSVGRARTISRALQPLGDMELPARAIRAASLGRLEMVLVAIDNAVTLAAAERIALTFAAERWSAVLLLDIADDAAMGRRGHGEHLSSVDMIILPLSSPSIVQAAYESGTPTMVAPAGPLQERLAHLLGDAASPAAAPIAIAGTVRGVLVVGDPRVGRPRDALPDLARLVDALSAAHERRARPAT